MPLTAAASTASRLKCLFERPIRTAATEEISHSPPGEAALLADLTDEKIRIARHFFSVIGVSIQLVPGNVGIGQVHACEEVPEIEIPHVRAFLAAVRTAPY
jgi:hypothetical protein